MARLEPDPRGNSDDGESSHSRARAAVAWRRGSRGSECDSVPPGIRDRDGHDCSGEVGATSERGGCGVSGCGGQDVHAAHRSRATHSADRVRERGESASGAHDAATPRNRDPDCARSEPRPARSAAVHGEPRARDDRRRDGRCLFGMARLGAAPRTPAERALGDSSPRAPHVRIYRACRRADGSRRRVDSGPAREPNRLVACASRRFRGRRFASRAGAVRAARHAGLALGGPARRCRTLRQKLEKCRIRGHGLRGGSGCVRRRPPRYDVQPPGQGDLQGDRGRTARGRVPDRANTGR